MALSSSHRNGCSAGAEVNGCGGRCLRSGAGSIAQLPIIVQSPALEVAVVKNGASVSVSSSHRNGRSAGAKVNRCGWR